MARKIVVTSGKGGVGKTTSAASFATGLAQRGYKTIVIDFDVGLRNLDLVMGCERRVVFDFVNVISGEASLKQAMIRDKRVDNLFVLAASQTRDKEALTESGVEAAMAQLDDEFDYIVSDSPAGIEGGALMAMRYADDAIIVTNPEVSSVRDSDRVLGMLASRTKRAEDGDEPVMEHLIVTRYEPSRVGKGEMLSLDDIGDILAVRLIGVVPESETVLNASNAGKPVVLEERVNASGAYSDAVARYLGEERPLRFTQARKSLIDRLMRR